MKLQPFDKSGTLQGFVLIKSCERKLTRTGAQYLDMIICDGEDDIVAKCWDYRGSENERPKPGELFLVRGTLNLYNNQNQFKVERLRRATPQDGVKLSDYVPSASFEGEEMFDELMGLVRGFQDEDLKKLTSAVLTEYRDKILELPAAFRLHHAIRGGLLMHTLSICKLACAVIALYPSVDGDLLLAGAILHDIAKSEEFALNSTGLVDGYTVPGTLIGHLVRGAMIVERIGKDLGIDEQTLVLIQHMLVSHHGVPEYGAAVRPLFLEAEILSALDTLDANIYEIENVVKDVAPGGFSNKVWALDDRKFHSHGRKKVVTDVRFDWHIEDGPAPVPPAGEADAPAGEEKPWTEIRISVPVRDIDAAASIVNMTVPYGIYIEDYSHLEEETLEISNIDLIDEELLQKDRTKGVVHVYISPENNPAEAVAFIRERLSAEKIPHEIELADCRNEDWENNWRQYFKPMEIGKKLLIRPVWIDDYDAGDRKVLNIEPGLAFGTGTHETTRLCMEALEDHVHPGTKMLDVGCGSGILSVAGMLLGAERVVGVDIDKLAVKVAKENGKLNGFEGAGFTMLHGNLVDEVNGKYDVVTANIVADAIIALTPDVKRFLQPDAVYIVSGIIDLREDEVRACLTANGFRVTARREENGWVCLESQLG